MSDPFDILGLPASFQMEQADLDRAFLAHSARLHPDLARADPDAARQMAALNHARRTLADPERRADALLMRLRGPPRERERGLPDGFLIEMMEVREEVESAMRAPDEGERAAARRKWESWGEERRRRAIEEVASMFERLEGPPSPEPLRQIRIRLNAWRYIERLLEQLDPDYDPRRADLAEEG
jgi:molecular chaperone HscB